MMPTHVKQAAVRGVNLVLITGLLGGCAAWDSRPYRVEKDFGNSVREMVRAQTYDQSKVLHPDPEPVKVYDGKKGERVLEKAYRQDIGKPQKTEQNIIFNIGGGK